MRELLLGDVVSPNRDAVRLQPDEEYATVGILSYGRGLFARPIVRGKDVSYSTYFRIEGDQFIYSKLFAWEGALTVVPPQFDGFFVSQEFPTFAVDRLVAHPQFLRLLTTWPTFWDRVREGESGMGGRRKRVHPDRLMAVPIPVPSLAEQSRIVDLVDALDCAIQHATKLAADGRTAWRAVADDLIGSAERRHPLSDGVLVTMGRQRSPQHATGDHMVPYLRAANVKDGRLELGDVLLMNFTPKEQETYALRAGDVLVTEGCGSLEQLGASSAWSTDLEGTVCFQNTLLRLRAIDGKTDPAFVHHLARYAHRAGWWATLASGTNIFHIGSERAKVMPTPFPTLDEQRTAALLLDAIDDVVREAEGERDALSETRGRVVSDLLSGDHEIPHSYDELLERAS